MLLREFTIDDHIISLIQEGDIYVAKVTNNNGEKLLHHEYTDYEKIKSCFDEIVQAIEKDKISIKDVFEILKRNPI